MARGVEQVRYTWEPAGRLARAMQPVRSCLSHQVSALPGYLRGRRCGFLQWTNSGWKSALFLLRKSRRAPCSPTVTCPLLWQKW